MITGLYAAWADSIPMLCITGQAPVAKLHKEDFQAVDIESIAKPVTKMAMTILEPGQVPGAFQKAFQLMRSGRPGPVLLDLPIDVQMAEIEFDIDTYEPLPVEKPKASRKQLEKALDMLTAGERPLIVAGGGIINAGASAQLVELAELLDVPVIPTLMGWGAIADDHPLMAGMVGLQTSHRYGNENYLRSDFVIGIGNRWANRHTGGLDTYTAGRKFVHIDIEPTQIGRVFSPDFGIASDAGAALDGLLELARERQRRRIPAGLLRLGCRMRRAQGHPAPQDQLRQRAHQAAARVPGDEQGLRQGHHLRVHHRSVPDRRRPDAARVRPAQVDQRRPGRPLGWTAPAALGVVRGKPDETVVALSGDYDFQFMIEELAVGAQFNLPYIHVVVNNSYLGLIRQSQRGFNMEQNVSLAFENINSPETNGYGVDHVKVAEGLGCKAIRVEDPNDLAAAFDKAKALAGEFKVPVVVEVILEKITNISMGVEINARERVRGTGRDQRGRPHRHPGRCRPKQAESCIAPDKFKGSLSAPDVARHLDAGLQAATGHNLDVIRIPVADGGEGTLDAAVGSGFTRRSTTGQRPHRASRCGPSSRSAASEAVIEMAAASGLAVLPGRPHQGRQDRHQPRHRRTDPGRARRRLPQDHSGRRRERQHRRRRRRPAGTRRRSSSTLTATNCRRRRRSPRQSGPDRLLRLRRPAGRGTDLSWRQRRGQPLLGAEGAAAIFGPQKGATPDGRRRILDAAVSHFVDVLAAEIGPRALKAADAPGAGAAGGVGYIAIAVLAASAGRASTSCLNSPDCETGWPAPTW